VSKANAVKESNHVKRAALLGGNKDIDVHHVFDGDVVLIVQSQYLPIECAIGIVSSKAAHFKQVLHGFSATESNFLPHHFL
jgi:hypothetical protein